MDKKPGAPRITPEGARRLTISISREDLDYLLTIHPQPSKAIRVTTDYHRKGQTNATDHHRDA